jgi:hypothetical protein
MTVVESVVATVDPFVPKVAKDAVQYSYDRATPILQSSLDYATKTVNGTVDYATKKVNGTVDYAAKTVNGTVDYAAKTVHGTVDYGKNVITNATNYASKQAIYALEFGKVVVNGATTTITAHTPGPVLSLIQKSLESANALRQDPVGTVKPYVPTFVIHIGEKSYEIVGQVQEQSVEGIKAASGFVVTKVNGTTQYVASVPLVASVIDRLNQITAPVLARFGKVNQDGTVSAETDSAPGVEPVADDKEQ